MYIFEEYKGKKITKRLQQYMAFAYKKFSKLKYQGEVELWDVLNSYEIIAEQEECVKKYIYDILSGSKTYYEEYKVSQANNGGIYIKNAI